MSGKLESARQRALGIKKKGWVHCVADGIRVLAIKRDSRTPHIRNWDGVRHNERRGNQVHECMEEERREGSRKLLEEEVSGRGGQGRGCTEGDRREIETFCGSAGSLILRFPKQRRREVVTMILPRGC